MQLESVDKELNVEQKQRQSHYYNIKSNSQAFCGFQNIKDIIKDWILRINNQIYK